MASPSLTKSRSKVFIGLCALYPCLLLAVNFDQQHGFLAVPRFGEQFHGASLDEVKSLDPPRKNSAGYDGQFYAQMALDPSLRNAQLPAAVDDLGYRGQRIGLSALAHVLGGGHVWLTLQIYSVLNLFFWFAMLVLAVRMFGLEPLQQRVCLIACLWSAGVLISITRALTDLPALTLSLLALWMSVRGGKSFVVFGGIATLFKETSVFSFLAYGTKDWKRNPIGYLAVMGLALVPLVIWQTYVRTQIGGGQSGFSHNFNWPLFGLVDKLTAVWQQCIENPTRPPLLELLGPISIAVQSGYLLSRWRWNDEFWRFGIGFACLTVVIAFAVWESQSAYSRVLLPLCISFNALLLRDSQAMSFRQYLIWFWLGNIGLLDRAIPGLVVWGILEWIWQRYPRPVDVSQSSTAAVQHASET